MLVSIITPFYEGNRYIEEYQEMILENEKNLKDGDSLEVLIVNDSPKTAVALSGTSLIRKNWKILTNNENIGIHGSRINGLSEASGEYVIFLDQDDLLTENAVPELIKAARENKDAAVIVANAYLTQEDFRSEWYRTAYHKEKIGDYATYRHIGTQIISPGQCLIKKDKIPEFWIYNPLRKNGADDYFLWILLLQAGEKFVYTDEVLYTHSYTGENISNRTEKTDASAYEFLDLLSKKEGFPEKDIKEIRTMLSVKDGFRNGGAGEKLRLSLMHPLIMLRNFRFKIGSHTKYGFNRVNNQHTQGPANSGTSGNS